MLSAKSPAQQAIRAAPARPAVRCYQAIRALCDANRLPDATHTRTGYRPVEMRLPAARARIETVLPDWTRPRRLRLPMTWRAAPPARARTPHADTGAARPPAECEESPWPPDASAFPSSATDCPLSSRTSTRTRPGSGWSLSMTSSRTHGRARARYVMLRLLERAREQQVGVPGLRSTDYINTIPPEREPWFPGDEYVERRIRAYIRWNAAIMVSRANRPGLGVGGHIATYASAASLYEVGFNHFFRGKDHGESGDQVFFQGHAAPWHLRPCVPRGPAHRAPAKRLPAGAVPPRRRPAVLPAPAAHARLLGVPDSLDGASAINAVHQARFNRYLLARRAQGHQPLARLGLPRRRRDRRARGAGRHRTGGPRGAGQPHLRDQLQPAATGRAGPRQRQDHPGARGRRSAAPAGT